MSTRLLKHPSDLVDKQKMMRPKTLHMKYPAPFSQSWSGPPLKQNKNAPTSRNPHYRADSYQKAVDLVRQRPQPPQICRGPNPFLPHLKYGLFHKKRERMQQAEPKVDKVSHNRKSKEVETPEPIYVMRPLERGRRRLSRAASTHLDIKPRSK